MKDRVQPSYESAAFSCYNRQHFLTATFSAVAVPLIVGLGALQGSNCTAGSGTVCGDDPHLNTFPYSSGLKQQLLWVLKRLPWLPCYLAVSYGVIANAIWQLLNLILAAAAYRQPRWYRQGGCSIVMACLRFCPIIEAACCLVFGFRHDIHQTVLTSFYGSCYNSIALIIWLTVMLQVPLAWHLKLVIPELLSLLYVRNKVFIRSGQPAMNDARSVVAFMLSHAAVSIGVPCVLVRFQAAHASHIHTAAPKYGSASCVQLSSSQKPHAAKCPASRLMSCRSCIWGFKLFTLLKSACSHGLGATHRERNGAVASASCQQHSTFAMRTAGTDNNESIKPALYKSKARTQVSTKVFSIKLHDHSAYDRREEISALVEDHVRKAYMAGNSGTLVSLKCTAWQGCLQLLLEITDEKSSTADATTATSILSAEDLQQLLSPILTDLKLHELVMFASDNVCSLIARHTPVIHPSTAEIQADTGPQLTASLLPSVVEAWSEKEAVSTVELVLSASAASSTPLDQDIHQLEVVACFQRDGQDTVLKQRVDAYSSVVRLELPSNIMAGPFSVHIFSHQPGYEGVLLGSFVTVALPPPEFQELQQLLELGVDDSIIRGGHVELLRDMALVWTMDQDVSLDATSRKAPSLTLQNLAHDLQAFFQENEMTACCENYSQRCENLLQSRQQSQLPEGTARTVGAQPDCVSQPEGAAGPSDARQLERVECLADPTAQARNNDPCSSGPSTDRSFSTSTSTAQQLPSHSRLVDSILGFHDKNLEAMYTQFRSGPSTRKSDTLCLGWYTMLMVVLHVRKAKMFMRWSLWYGASLLPCIVAYGMLASPLRARVASRRCTVIGIARLLNSWLHALCNQQGWIVGNPKTLKEMTDCFFDLLFCLQFPLVTQTRLTFWVLASAAGECVAEVLGFGPAIGYKAATTRMLAAHILGAVGVVKIDIWARNAFLKGLGVRGKKVE